MRLRAGRPSLAEHAALFDVPLARGQVSVTFAGVSTLLFDDGESALLTDGFFTRPSLLRTVLGRLEPDAERVASCLGQLGASRIAAVLPVHSHFDHALDSALVAQRAGAVLVGGVSTMNVGRGLPLPADQLQHAAAGRPLTFGAWRVTPRESRHCPPDRFPGVIDEPLRTPAKVGAWKCGEAWSLEIQHDSGLSALVLGSAGFVPGALAGVSADVVYLGVGQLGLQDEDYLTTYWHESVELTGARRVVLTHWDDFFRPLDQPLRALPYAGDDLDRTISILRPLAQEQGVAFSMPTVWRREDPWRQASGGVGCGQAGSPGVPDTSL